MRVKKYTATTMNNALVQIKEELGPDAVILIVNQLKKVVYLVYFKRNILK